MSKIKQSVDEWHVNDKLKYLGCTIEQIVSGGHDPREILTIGNIYTIKKIWFEGFFTRIWLTEYPGKEFNSVYFEKVIK